MIGRGGVRRPFVPTSVVRAFEPGDEDAVYQLWQESVVADNPIARQLDRWGPGIAVPIADWHHTGLVETPPEPGHAVRRVLSQLLDGSQDYVCFVAVDLEPIGFVVGTIEGNPLFVGEVGSIDVLFVTADRRRSGVASSLVKEIERWFHHRSIHQLRATYDRGQSVANRFWNAQQGWQPSGELARCHG